MADNNAEGQVEILLRVLSREAWAPFWAELQTTVVTFEDLALPREASDAELWRTCQREQVILITNNRNADDPDSLETVIRGEPARFLARFYACQVQADRAGPGLCRIRRAASS